MKRLVYKSIFYAFIMALLASLSACYCGIAEEPYLDDRTEGWIPRLTIIVDFELDELDAESSELWRSVLSFKPYSFNEKITGENIAEAAAEAIELNLGKPIASMGLEYELIEKHGSSSENDVIGLLWDSKLVLFDADGRLKFCADIDSIDAMKMTNGATLQLTVNAAGLSSSALSELQELSTFNDPIVAPNIGGIAFPLTAKGAFDISVGMDVKSWNGSSPLAATGGAFRVYYSEASNAMFVVTNTYIQAFDADNGRMLMMHPYASLGNGRYGNDESIRLE